MGLVILPVAGFFLLLWLTAVVVVSVVGVLTIRALPGGRLLQLIVPPLVAVLFWYVPNAKAIRIQAIIDKVNKDCGWAVSARLPAVNGIFVESTATVPPGRFADEWLTRYYPIVQFRTSDDKIFERSARTAAQEIPSRTMRYGIRFDRTKLDGGVIRDSSFIVDFDADAVVAKHVTYDYPFWPEPREVSEYALALMTMRPVGCEGLELNDFSNKLHSVMPAVGAAVKVK